MIVQSPDVRLVFVQQSIGGVAYKKGTFGPPAPHLRIWGSLKNILVKNMEK